MKNKSRGLLNKGFTLIEMLVVIAIIGILATLIIFSVMGTRQKAGATKAKADMAQLKSALEKANSVDGCNMVTINSSGNAATLYCVTSSNDIAIVQAPPYGAYKLNVNGCEINSKDSSSWNAATGCVAAGKAPSTYTFSASGFSDSSATYSCTLAGCSCSSGNCDTY